MPFLSIEFAVFFLLFFPLYWWLAPAPSLQNKLLLMASLAWLVHLQLMFAVAVIGFSVMIGLIAARIVSSADSVMQRRWLIAGISLALLHLVAFKYADDWRALLQHTLPWPMMDVLLPLGISYYTFQGIAYLVALYREQGKGWPEAYSCRMNGVNLLLHFSFFPTVTAGPIARAAPSRFTGGQHVGMALQINTTKRRVVLRPALALALMVLGAAKVWWFAGAISSHWVVPVFDNPFQYDRATILLAIYGYTLELFFNFSGYTDLVIGLALLLGFSLPPNFAQPLRAVNIRDFWRRWHISLSTWIRDSIYIPLGGSRRGYWRTQVHVMVAMVLSGIWHGNGWPFLVWGALHGAAMVVLNTLECLTGRRALFGRTRFARAGSIMMTVTFVAVAFVFFRAERLDDAWVMFQALWSCDVALDPAAVLALLGLSLLLWCYDALLSAFHRFVRRLSTWPYWSWPLVLGVVMMVVVVCAPPGIPGFIYAAF